MLCALTSDGESLANTGRSSLCPLILNYINLIMLMTKYLGEDCTEMVHFRPAVSHAWANASRSPKHVRNEWSETAL